MDLVLITVSANIVNLLLCESIFWKRPSLAIIFQPHQLFALCSYLTWHFETAITVFIRREGLINMSGVEYTNPYFTIFYFKMVSYGYRNVDPLKVIWCILCLVQEPIHHGDNKENHTYFFSPFLSSVIYDAPKAVTFWQALQKLLHC